MRAFFLFVLCFATALEGLTEQEWVKRIFAHQLVHDDLSATADAQKALAAWPGSRSVWQAYIKVLALRGDEKGVNQLFVRYAEKFENPYDDRELLESMAWGVISNGARSPYPNVRLMAMLGAFFSQDAKGVDYLKGYLSDQNTLIREACMKLTSHMRDQKLKSEVMKRFREESNWGVRLEMIRAIGAMHMTESKGELVSILTSKRTGAEEKAAAIESIVNLMDTAERGEIESLVKSDRAGLRLLACQIVEHFDLERDLDLVYPLLRDYHPDIRAAAIHVIANFRGVEELEPKAKASPSFSPPAVLQYLEPLLSDPDQKVALTAAWAMTLFDPERGQKAFERFLNHSSIDTCRMASACLAATGKYGVGLMRKTFAQSKDPYVRINLALGLVGQRVEMEQACRVLYEGVVDTSFRLMWQEHSFFRVLVPAQASHSLLQNPEEMNQLVRLEILNTLSVLKDPLALAAMRNYLKKKQWGITSLAATVLLKEGDESAIAVVQEVMNDPDPQVSFQAALIVALWGRDESAIQVLQQAYPTAARENKERILEGLGRIGSKTSIPFLTSKLQEPAQPLRLIAAATLLQCLYN